MARTHTAPTQPQYVVIPRGDLMEVTDRLNGYTLSTHMLEPAARGAAAALNASPAAAVSAHLALAQAQSGRAAEARRALLHYGYRWTLDVLTASHVGIIGERRTEELVGSGDLIRVWSPTGEPFVTTPERFRELDVTALRDKGSTYPSAPRDQLARPQQQLWAIPDSRRNERCACGGSFISCPVCGPVEDWECDWSVCRANAVTQLAGRRLCAHDFWPNYQLLRTVAQD